MRAKTIVTAGLLAFVAASIVALIIEQSSSGGDSQCSQPAGPHVVTRNTPEPESDKVVVYYFHGMRRCPTCLRIEAYAREALESGFGDALRSGKLQWRAINVDDRENRHYIQDYALVSKSLIASAVKNGRQKQWKDLQQIWELVGDKEAFLRYLQQEVRKYLEELR